MKRKMQIVLVFAISLASTITITITCAHAVKHGIKKFMPDSNPSGGLSAALPVAGQVVDQVIGGIFQGAANKKNRRFAREMYQTQRADALADWNAQNQYNSPAAQMARLREAGLNPHLIYGGNSGIMQAAVVRSSDMGKYEAQPLPGSQLGAAMGQYLSVKLGQAQLNNMEAQTELLRKQAANQTINTIKTFFEGEHSKFDLARKEELKNIIFEKGVADLNLAKAHIDSTVMSNQRAEELQPMAIKSAKQALTGQEIQQAGMKIDNVMKRLQSDQYSDMRPLELARMRSELDHLKSRISQTIQQTKNEEQLTRLNKMEADLGKGIKIFDQILGGITDRLGPSKKLRR